MELGLYLNSFIPVEHKAKAVLGLCRLESPTLLPQSSNHAGQDAALAPYPGLIQAGYHQKVQEEWPLCHRPMPTKIWDEINPSSGPLAIRAISNSQNQ